MRNVNSEIRNSDLPGQLLLRRNPKRRNLLVTSRDNHNYRREDSGNFITDLEDDFQFQFGSQRDNPNSRHPFYNNHYELGDGDYLSNYFMWKLRAAKMNEIRRTTATTATRSTASSTTR